MAAETKPAEGLARLREPFPKEHVGLLPRITCGQCSQASGRCCAQHNKSKCTACDNYITERHIHLDYVGHGAVTDRLLEVDPAWNWEPMTVEPSGTPAFVFDKNNNPVEFWIKLTVCGVTRLGVGTCPSGQFDAAKVLIGDALRNAAMRFGVALDLWIKGHGEDDERTSATDERSGPNRPPPSDPSQTIPAASVEQVAEIQAFLSGLTPEQVEKVEGWAMAKKLPGPDRLNADQATETFAYLTAEFGAPAETVEPF